MYRVVMACELVWLHCCLDVGGLIELVGVSDHFVIALSGVFGLQLYRTMYQFCSERHILNSIKEGAALDVDTEKMEAQR